MVTTTLLSLLQAVALLLTAVQGGKIATPAIQTQAVNMAGNAVQLAAQVADPVGFTVTKNDSIWPNMKDLLNAPYRDANGKWIRLGASVQLIEGDTSFGDLNHDGLDDAAVVVKKQMADGSQNYFLAAMLNQGGILFDIADLPLGPNFEATSHKVASSGDAVLNGRRYELVGDKLQSYN